MTSFKDDQQVVHNGLSKVLGQVVDHPVNKNRAGLGFSAKNGKGEGLKPKSTMRSYHDVFRSRGYLHLTVSGVNSIKEDEEDQEVPNYVTPVVRIQNWVTYDVPSCIHVSK